MWTMSEQEIYYIKNFQNLQVCLKHTPPASKILFNIILQHMAFLLDIETAIYVLIDALRNISPSELKYVLFHI